MASTTRPEIAPVVRWADAWMDEPLTRKIPRAAPVELLPISGRDYTIPGRYPLLVRFETGRLVLNPGHWQQVGER